MKVTIRDIAEMANVSVATVSRVLNNKSKGVGEDTRKKIQKLIEELNYQPNAVARGLATKKSRIIGLLIPDIANPFYPKLIKGVEDVAHKSGYNIILCDGHNSEEKEAYYLDFLNEHYVSGIIYNNYHRISDTILDKIVKSSLPLVFIDSKIDVPGSVSIYLDNMKAMYDLVQRLIHLGHERIAFIVGPQDTYSGHERLKGYLKALEDNNIEKDEALIIESDYVLKEGYHAMGRLLDRNVDMSVVIGCNDLIAIGALEKLIEQGISVPEELSLVGFDNLDMTRLLNPKLSTVAQPIYEMGREAARMVIDIIEGKVNGNITDKVFQPEIIIRDSIKKLKK